MAKNADGLITTILMLASIHFEHYRRRFEHGLCARAITHINQQKPGTAPNNVITLPVQFSIRFECEIFSGTWMDYHLLHRMRAHGQQRRSEKRAGTQGLYPQHTLPFDGQDDG